MRDRLLEAYRRWLDASAGGSAKFAWRDLAKCARQRGLQSRDAAALVLKLKQIYPHDTTQ